MSADLVALHDAHRELAAERDAAMADYRDRIRAACRELETAVEEARLAYVATRTSAEPDLRWLEYESAVTLAPTEALIDLCDQHGLRKPKARKA